MLASKSKNKKHLCVQGAKYPIPGAPRFKLVPVPPAGNVVWGHLEKGQVKSQHIWAEQKNIYHTVLLLLLQVNIGAILR